MKIRKTVLFVWILGAAAAATVAQTSAPPQSSPAPAPAGSATPYQPKFSGDPARSDSESAALGYMRVVVRAQKLYQKKHNEYATSLKDLINTGSFTRRMAASTERGDYTVGFKGKKDSYVLIMTPKNLDAEHRSFYSDEDGVIHADDTKAADSSSPKVK